MATKAKDTKEEIIEEKNDATGKKSAAAEKKTVAKIKKPDPNQYITVKNGFNGILVYKSKRTGEVFEWGHFGDEFELELHELLAARNSCRAFFQNNWFMFNEEDDWVLDYLGVRQFYKNALGMEDFDTLFDLPAEELEERLSTLSDGQKESVAYRASAMITSGEIDSKKKIAVLEKAFGVSL